MTNNDLVQRIKENSDIITIIGESVSLRKQGASYMGLCPFHSERTPSFSVNPSKGLFHCFGCGKGGDVFTFVMEHDGMTFPEAVRHLAGRAGIPCDDLRLSPQEQEKYNKRKSLKAVLAYAAKDFAETRSPNALVYLNSRDFSPKVLLKFGIGNSEYCDRIKYSALEDGYTEAILFDASLILKTENGETHDFFRKRIMFPIHDLYGDVIAFAGRVVGDNPSTKRYRYLNSRETELYSKSKELYRIDLAKQAISKEDECILVEGYFDVIRLYQLGFENVVAPCGTALTKEQISLIRRFTSNVVLMYDGDPPGQKATLHNAELALGGGMNIRIVRLPKEDDPDSFGQKYGRNAVKKVIEEAVNIVDYLVDRNQADTPEQVTSNLKDAQRMIGLISDPAVRQVYINHAAQKFNISADTIEKGIRTENISKVKAVAIGWQALDIAKESIKEKNFCRIVSNSEDLIEAHTSGEAENTVSFAGNVEQLPISELKGITSRVKINEQLFDENCIERPIASLARRLVHSGFMVTSDSEGKSQFLVTYADECAKQIKKAPNNDNLHRELINNCATMLSASDETTVAIHTKSIAEALGLKESSLNKIKKSLPTEKNDSNRTATKVGEVLENSGLVEVKNEVKLHPEDQIFLDTWEFCPRRDINGKKIGYSFRKKKKLENGEVEESFNDVANFYMQPLFHNYDKDPTKNKRVVRITSAEHDDEYIEFQSENMIDLNTFKKKLFNEGGYLFTGGSQAQLEKIIEATVNEFPKCYTLNIYGYQNEDGFYAFVNAIFSNGEIKYVNELGLVEHGGKTYYSPPCSVINEGYRKDDGKYENDRLFMYRDNNETTFDVWAKLLVDVYKSNNNGMWAVLFAIMSAFRSLIYPIGRFFTAPFFIGPTGCGKTQIALSIRSLFITPDAPSFNLNSGTDAAFFTSMVRYRDVAMIYEEYNNKQISDNKFQGLKAAVHDGDGKQKRKDVNSTDLDISKVNCAIILLGQESPERDDGALTNRVIVLPVPKKDDWTDDERNTFDDLKTREKAGLSNILVDILKHRNIVTEHYPRLLRDFQKELQRNFSESGDKYLTRLLNTVSLFLAMAKLVEDYMPSLKLPFSFKEFYDIAREKVISQSSNINETNRLSHFFIVCDSLLNLRDGIIEGRDFKIIEGKTSITLDASQDKTYRHTFETPKKIIYLRIKTIHIMYERIQKEEALNLDSLRMYLLNHPAYIGHISSTRFKWTEYTDEANELGDVKRVGKSAEQNTSAIVMDYEILKKSSGVDFEKFQIPDDKQL